MSVKKMDLGAAGSNIEELEHISNRLKVSPTTRSLVGSTVGVIICRLSKDYTTEQLSSAVERAGIRVWDTYDYAAKCPAGKERIPMLDVLGPYRMSDVVPHLYFVSDAKQLQGNTLWLEHADVPGMYVVDRVGNCWTGKDVLSREYVAPQPSIFYPADGDGSNIMSRLMSEVSDMTLVHLARDLPVSAVHAKLLNAGLHIFDEFDESLRIPHDADRVDLYNAMPVHLACLSGVQLYVVDRIEPYRGNVAWLSHLLDKRVIVIDHNWKAYEGTNVFQQEYLARDKWAGDDSEGCR